MKTIKLTKGHEAFVDDEDYEYLNQFNWCVTGKEDYAVRGVMINGTSKMILMHRLIMDAEKGLFVDHKDRNGLNNQRSNLRICTHSQNLKNRNGRGTSKYLGVNRHTTKRKYLSKKTGLYTIYTCSAWITHIKANGKYRHLGRFKTELEAAIIYNIAARKYHGEFANPNKFN